MIKAKDIVIALGTDAAPERPDIREHERDIDTMLSKPWRKDELEDDEGPDCSDSNYAGRSYSVKGLSVAICKEIRRVYEAAGWTIVPHGNRTDNAYTDPKSAGQWYRFIPPNAKSSWVRR